jgi:S-adenosylmethionine:tRNA ribosyltransferase-isomerase
MKLSDFDFALPDRLIAQHPAPERDHSKMMVIWRETGKREHLRFRDLPDILGPEHFLVLNNTRVLSARLRAHRPGKNEEIEILLLRELQPGDWMALVKPGRKAPLGQTLEIGELSAQVLEVTESGSRVFRFHPSTDLLNAFEKLGEPPTPPYIRRQSTCDFAEDRIRYQTVYAEQSGSVAAPTAGLHFTEEILHRLDARGIDICKLLLHVGYGTFKPIRAEIIEEHAMEPEYYEIDDATALKIRSLKTAGRKLISVGTTSTRCLEFLARQEHPLAHGSTGYCNLFIYPGFEFKMLDGLITNFHLPQSTLFMLACAFAGRELMLDCYQEAVSMDYRFYSYGDCMLLL